MKILITFILLFAHSALAVNLNNTAVTLTTASVSSSALALAANANRKYLLIQNNGTSSIYVKFGSTISTTEGITLAAGGNYEPIIPPIGAIYMKASTGTQTVTIYEGN